MMGYNHVSCGLVAGLATLPVAPVTGPAAQAAWVIALGGASLLPDLDTTGSAATNLAISIVTAWWLITHGAQNLRALALVVAGGVLVHILGDLPTREGVPFPIAWLFGVRRRISLDLSASTVPSSVSSLPPPCPCSESGSSAPTSGSMTWTASWAGPTESSAWLPAALTASE